MYRYIIYAFLCFTHFMCVHGLNRKGGFFSRINNSIGNFISGKTSAHSNHENPHISLKIKPATSLHLTRNELNMLLLEVKHEVTKQMEQLEDELADKGREDEKHMSTWTINHSPVYIPFAKTIETHSGDNSKNERLKNDTKEFKHNPTHRTEESKLRESKIAET